MRLNVNRASDVARRLARNWVYGTILSVYPSTVFHDFCDLECRLVVISTLFDVRSWQLQIIATRRPPDIVLVSSGLFWCMRTNCQLRASGQNFRTAIGFVYLDFLCGTHILPTCGYLLAFSLYFLCAYSETVISGLLVKILTSPLELLSDPDFQSNNLTI